MSEDIKMEIGVIEGFRFILSPPMPDLRRPRRRKQWDMPESLDSFWQQLYKSIPENTPRITSRRSTSARKRKAIYNSLSRRVPAGWIAFLSA